MQNLTVAEIELALTDTLHRLWRARDFENFEAEIVYEAQLDRLLGWWQARTSAMQDLAADINADTPPDQIIRTR